MIKNSQTSENFIVLEASAGSGKTHNLAKRYITLLLNFDLSKKENIPLKNILALTFANKASIEMKERIIEYLKKISLKQDVGDLLNEITIPSDKIVLNANAAMNFIIEHYDNFNVKTIDSFINLIIKSCALTIGLSPDYKIEKNDKEYIDFAIDSFLDNSLSDKKLEKLLEDFFEQYLINSHSSWDIKKDICEEFIKLYEDIKKSAKQLKNDYAKTDYKASLLNYSEHFYDCCLQMTKIKEFKNFNKKITNNISEIIEYGKKYLLTNQTISKYFQKEELPYLSKTEHNRQLDDLFFKAQKILKDFYEFKAFSHYNVYMQMFEYIITEFDRQSKNDSVIFLQDLNRKVLKIFSDDSEIVPEIYCRLSSYFKDFLIDEFQDTNQIQWKTLKLIVEENLSQGGSFFYVGDKKQAIYGFRGGDFKIFDQPLEEFSRYKPSKQQLGTNYRSYKAVVDFNNYIFSKENISGFFTELIQDEKIEDIPEYTQTILDVFASPCQEYSENKKENGYVEISSAEYDDETKEEVEDKIKEYLYKTIESLKDRFDYKDITVICRHNDDIEKIGQWLLEKGIDIESYQTLNIVNSDIIKELFSILKFLNSPTDEIAFTSFITSSIFIQQTNLSKNEILDFIVNNSLNKNKQNVLYILFRERYPDIWEEYIEPFFNSVGFIAVYELTVAVISKYNVIDNFKNSNNVILRFLEVVSAFEAQNQGLQNFIDYFQNTEQRKQDNEFFIKIPSSNAIRIITAHKAKGLQFNVVIMPYLDLKFAAPAKPFNIQDSKYIQFLNISQEVFPYSDALKEIYYKKYFKNMSDELNILYVAMTRAVCEFYGLILKKKDNKKNIIHKLLPENARQFGQKVKYIFNSNKESDTITLSLTQMKDFTEIISESSMEIYGQDQQELLLRGQIIHYCLSAILTYNKSNINEKIQEALNLGAVKYPNEDISWVEDLLKKLLNDVKIAEFFNDSNEVYNEKEFVDSFGNTIRIDKLIINKNKLSVIDFKTSFYNPEIINRQMLKYLSVIKEIYPDKEADCFVVDIEKTDVVEIK